MPLINYHELYAADMVEASYTENFLFNNNYLGLGLSNDGGHASELAYTVFLNVDIAHFISFKGDTALRTLPTVTPVCLCLVLFLFLDLSR